jgi:hypothetical protein
VSRRSRDSGIILKIKENFPLAICDNRFMRKEKYFAHGTHVNEKNYQLTKIYIIPSTRGLNHGFAGRLKTTKFFVG